MIEKRQREMLHATSNYRVLEDTLSHSHILLKIGPNSCMKLHNKEDLNELQGVL